MQFNYICGFLTSVLALAEVFTHELCSDKLLFSVSLCLSLQFWEQWFVLWPQFCFVLFCFILFYYFILFYLFLPFSLSLSFFWMSRIKLYLLTLYFIEYAITAVPNFPPFPPLHIALYSLRQSPYLVLSMHHTCKFYGYSVSYTVLNTPMDILWLPNCTF